MAVNLSMPQEAAAVPGVSLASGAAAIKATGRDDVTLISLAPGTSVAGVFTRSSFRAAPVLVAEQSLAAAGVRALLINSGNANAATGDQGLKDAQLLCATAAQALDVAAEAVAPFSTGVIGERLPVERMLPVVEKLAAGLRGDGWLDAANAIMTTDTLPKLMSRAISIGDSPVTITGMAKGAGMIRPDMATLLAFICCDADVTRECLQGIVRDVVAGSFNRITVDGDTSTNDAFIVAATGIADHPQISDPDSEAAEKLRAGLLSVGRTLAQAIVRDGEGATKFVTVRVKGGRDEAECLQVAYTLAESPLVKTALFASDPNWGRLAMAIGRAGVADLEVSGIKVWFDTVAVMTGGVQAPTYSEDAGAGVLAQDEFSIRIDLGRGDSEAEIWTSDLSYDYVRINAEYRT